MINHRIAHALRDQTGEGKQQTGANLLDKVATYSMFSSVILSRFGHP